MLKKKIVYPIRTVKKTSRPEKYRKVFWEHPWRSETTKTTITTLGKGRVSERRNEADRWPPSRMKGRHFNQLAATAAYGYNGTASLPQHQLPPTAPRNHPLHISTAKAHVLCRVKCSRVDLMGETCIKVPRLWSDECCCNFCSPSTAYSPNLDPHCCIVADISLTSTIQWITRGIRKMEVDFVYMYIELFIIYCDLGNFWRYICECYFQPISN